MNVFRTIGGQPEPAESLFVAMNEVGAMTTDVALTAGPLFPKKRGILGTGVSGDSYYTYRGAVQAAHECVGRRLHSGA